MKKAWTILGIILLVLLVAAGSFWGGMNYESNRAERVRANFMGERGQGNMGSFTQAGQIPVSGMPSGLPGGGVMGPVKAVEGDVISVSTAENVTTVLLDDETQIWKSVTVDIVELQPGTRVRVTGEKDEDGNVKAEQITILSDESSGEMLVDPSAAAPPETEP